MRPPLITGENGRQSADMVFVCHTSMRPPLITGENLLQAGDKLLVDLLQ